MKIYKIAMDQVQTVRFTCPITGIYVDGLRENGKFHLFNVFSPEGKFIEDVYSFEDAVQSAKRYNPKSNVSRSGKLVRGTSGQADKRIR